MTGSQRTDARQWCHWCDDKINRELTLYCSDCDKPMCETCFIRHHNGHKHVDIDQVAAQLRDQLRQDADKLDFFRASDNASLLTMEKWCTKKQANVQVRLVI